MPAKILIVDDNETMRMILGEFLEMEGYDCTTAASARQACKLLNSKPIDLVISDLIMPRETGLDLLQHVASECPQVGFIMVAGMEDSDIRRRAMNMGAHSYILKPFKFKELLDSVQDALNPEVPFVGIVPSRYPLNCCAL